MVTLFRIICLVGAMLAPAATPLLSQQLELLQTDSAGVHSGIDTLNARRKILFVGQLNLDCLADTIVGVRDQSGRLLPTLIRWGRLDLPIPPPPCPDDTTAPDTSYHLRRVPVTVIDYPAWDRVTGSISFQRYNRDQFTDLIFFLWGNYRTSGGVLRDTATAIAVFGQRGLDTIAVLSLNAIASFQSEPFFAMNLRPGVHLLSPAVRDMSGSISLLMPTINIPLHEQPTPPEPPFPPGRIAEVPTFALYPNPTPGEALIQGSRVPEGEYRIEVVAVNGMVVHRQQAYVDLSGEVLKALKLESVPSGYYVVQLYDAVQRVGSWPILVRR